MEHDSTGIVVPEQNILEFRYDPLNINDIRVLKPMSDSRDSLSFKIIHVSLDSKKLHYAALSYRWGPRGNTHRVLINGQNFPVQPNLYNALWQIEKSKLIDQHIWVDAICINQGEDAKPERSVQVTMMRQIYERADKVLVWLGKPNNEVNNRLAFSLMERFAKRFLKLQSDARPYRPWWWQHQARTIGQDVSDFLSSLMPALDKTVYDVPGSPTHNAWLGMQSIWTSDWWTRTWIFQEATIPEPYKLMFVAGIQVRPVTPKVRFLCGDQQATWAEFDVVKIVATSIMSTPGLDSSLVNNTIRKPADDLQWFRGERIRNVPWSFLEILQMFRNTDCTDLRDKVYAPLCLAPAGVSQHIIPDYTNKTIYDVLIDIVRYCLAQSDHELDFLGYTMYQEGTQVVNIDSAEVSSSVRSYVLPSWVPNFSARVDIVPIPKLLYVPDSRRKSIAIYDKRGIPNNKRIKAYQPLRDMPSNCVVEGDVLCISGVRVDSIRDLVPDDGPDLEANRRRGREIGLRWDAALSHTYFTGESFGDVMQRTSVLDIVYDDYGRPSERGGKVDYAFLGRPRVDLGPAEYRHQMNMRNAKIQASKLRRRGLSQNLYIMMVPRTAEIGDEVWALAGGNTLYVLRLLDGETMSYTYVGECYAHGLMDGEIMRKIESGASRMETISLI